MRKKHFHLSGFTLAEILISVAIIAILSTMLLTSNVRQTLQKGHDSKRKQDLNKLARVFEDYYNDKLGYPAPGDGGTISSSPWGSPFSSYVPELPKDPASPRQDYYYQADATNPSYFAIYTKLENTADPDIERVGCQNGCGPGLSYNYVVHSPNVVMIAGLPDGHDPGSGGGTPGDGGPGGDGGGEPSPTAGPTSTPAPTATPLPTPYPTNPYAGPGSCNFGSCGICSCGEDGRECSTWECCIYTSEWRCEFRLACFPLGGSCL